MTTAGVGVYFVQVESGPIKIGSSLEVRRRVRTLQIGCHEELRLLAVLPDALGRVIGADSFRRNAIASACGVSEQTVRNWVSGACSPRRRCRQILSDRHGIAIDAWDAPLSSCRGAA